MIAVDGSVFMATKDSLDLMMDFLDMLEEKANEIKEFIG